MARIVNGLITLDRTPSISSSFGGGSSILDAPIANIGHGHGNAQSPRSKQVDSHDQRQTRTSDGSSKGSKRYVPKLEDFQLIKVIGKGCAGRVLLVKHSPSNSVRAMKAISKRSVLTHDELNHTLTEQSILKRFAIDEPHNRFISRLHHSFTDRENFYFVMEFYPGGDLATQMEIYGILGDHRTRFYAADIVQGLEDLHRHGIIVRDLKPENILLNTKGHAVLADFGLSKEFSYRGDPKPVHVVTYPGQPELPRWAGAGAGSMRTLASGQQRLMIDKAYSFVGTSEYLSPEVVKRAEYSYAVDWWALGCIVLEGLVGRVPFRKAEDEPLLLQKDPMWRLTEPCIKQHEYFAFLDWDTVARGEYEDPHGLHLHPVAEYNTRYFPKLCLEEDPTVDMSTHDMRENDGFARTPLNDNQLYALEQAKYRPELESFTWSRDQDWYETYTESEVEVESNIDVAESEQEEQEGVISIQEGLESVEESPVVHKVPLHDQSVDIIDEAAEVEVEVEGEALRQEEDVEGRYRDEEDASLEFAADSTAEDAMTPESAAAKPSTDDAAGPASLVTHESSANAGRPITLPDSSACGAGDNDLPVESTPTSVDAPSPKGAVDGTVPHDSLSPIPNTVHSPPSMHSTETLIKPASSPADSPTPQVKTPPLALPPHLRDIVSPSLSSHPASAGPVPIPLRPKPVRQLSHELDLPAGPPSSGLSVSEVISVRSQHPGSPTRIVRRHRQLPSVDTIPIARLSVELHGTITHIDDEEWEELIPQGPDASAPNGVGTGQHSFFGRGGLGGVLRRRPSTLVGSGLRRQARTSDTSSKGSMSPTKPRPTLFTAKSIENTKKAFDKLKTFPKLKGLAPEWKGPNLSLSANSTISPLTSPPMSGAGSASDPNVAATGDRIGNNNSSSSSLSNDDRDRPSLGGRRHTESRWFEKRRKAKASISVSGSAGNSTTSSPKTSRKFKNGRSSNPSAGTSVNAAADDSLATSGKTDHGDDVGRDEIPRLELGELGGLDWEFDGREWGVK
ncbi:AGC protein kinase [Kwoniella heveanensis CBS 569]|nr:AGC protein kinase [Kwoniella heveanensis CBS 569]